MKSAVILHSVSDAEHCVANKLHEGRMLFSTHSSVDVYLKDRHNLDCLCLSRFISKESFISEKVAWIEKVNCLLKNLDRNLSPVLNKRYNLKMNYFTPLYSFYGGYHLLNYVWFVNCVKSIIDIYGLEKIVFYDYRFNKFLNASSGIDDLASLFFGNIHTEIVRVPENGGILGRKGALKNITNKLERLKGHDLDSIYNVIIAGIHKYRFKRFSSDRKTILVCELLYELEFLCDRFSEYNVLYYDIGKESFFGV